MCQAMSLIITEQWRYFAIVIDQFWNYVITKKKKIIRCQGHNKQAPFMFLLKFLASRSIKVLFFHTSSMFLVCAEMTALQWQVLSHRGNVTVDCGTDEYPSVECLSSAHSLICCELNHCVCAPALKRIYNIFIHIFIYY